MKDCFVHDYLLSSDLKSMSSYHLLKGSLMKLLKNASREGVSNRFLTRHGLNFHQARHPAIRNRTSLSRDKG